MASISLSGDVTVAIDMGTSCTAYSFKAMNSESIAIGVPDQIQRHGINEKSPTAVLIEKRPGGMLSVLSFGAKAEGQFAASDGSTSDGGLLFIFKEFKMALHEHKVAYSSPDEPEVEGMGKGEGRSGLSLKALVVTSMALGYIKDHVLEALRISQSRLYWVVTVPAISTDFAKGFMREAAEKAGLVLPGEDVKKKLKLVLEPEVACLAMEKHNDWEIGSKVMVLDCGGGTVDITTWVVKENNPLGLEGLRPASGGPWGATFVDQEFERFMKDLMGDDNWNALAGSDARYRLLKEWEKAKTRYDGGPEVVDIIISHLRRPLGLTSKQLADWCEDFNEIQEIDSEVWVKADEIFSLSLSPALMRSFYKGIQHQIIEHVRDELRQPELEGMDRIYMVGGFSQSKLLQEAVVEGFKSMVKIEMPIRPSLAVIFGAPQFFSERGDTNTKLLSTKARMSYGFVEVHLFNPNNPEHTQRQHMIRVVGKPPDTVRMIPVFHPIVRRGDNIDLPVHTSGRHACMLADSHQAIMNIKIITCPERDVVFLNDEKFPTATVFEVKIPMKEALELKRREEAEQKAFCRGLQRWLCCRKAIDPPQEGANGVVDLELTISGADIKVNVYLHQSSIQIPNIMVSVKDVKLGVNTPVPPTRGFSQKPRNTHNPVSRG